MIDNFEQVDLSIMPILDNHYALSFYPDMKISYKWYRIILLVKYEEGLDGVHDFVSTCGVSSYMKVLYELLGKNFK